MEGPYGDFFVIDDEGTFYIAVNIRGLKREIVYERAQDGSQKSIKIGDRLDIRLLTLRDSADCSWETIGNIYIDPDHRNGFWEENVKGHTFKSLSMLGIFDPDNENVFFHTSTHPFLKDQRLPMLYKWLSGSAPSERIGEKAEDKE